MKIDKNSYSLSDKHFHSEKYKKRKIVLSNSLCGDMKFFRGWELRRNGTYKKVTNFSVDTNGEVYEHYNPTYHSEFMGSEQLDKETITIRNNKFDRYAVINYDSNIYTNNYPNYRDKGEQFNYKTTNPNFNNQEILGYSIFKVIQEINRNFYN